MTPRWDDNAACKGEPYERFFGTAGEAFDPRPALNICDECPVREACHVQAIHDGDIGADGRATHGVIAGVAPPQRQNAKPAPLVRLPRLCALAGCDVRFTQSTGRPGGVRMYCCDEHSIEGRRLQKQASWERNRRRAG